MQKIIKPIVSISTILMVAFSPFVALTPTVLAGGAYSIVGNVSIIGFNVNLNGTASAYPYVGQLSNQHISVDWGLNGDATPNNWIELFTPYFNITNSGGSGNNKWFDATWATSSTYINPGIYTIFVRVYHANINGAEGSDVATWSINITVPNYCGDGEVDPGEACDDGNTTNGDGCSSTCTIEGCIPTTEICDGLDNDCDGQIDNGLLWLNKGNSCTVGVGECAAQGTLICNTQFPAGELICSATPGTSTDETCDNKDNNCDGNIDENLTQPTSCGVGVCAGNTGSETCIAGVWDNNTCDPFEGAELEVCDGVLDEDCDGIVDEGCECTNGDSRQCGQTDVGECSFGTQTCIDGQWDATCVGVINPTDELCDGLDNDCDGSIDEDFANLGQTCEAGEGICQTSGVYVCSQDGLNTQCNAVAGTPTTETCDGLDNDCDGQIDNGFNVGQTCTVGIGVCQATGAYVCTQDGLGTECNAIPGQSSEEICDNELDDDCDGYIDTADTDCQECIFEATTTCSTGNLGICSAGIRTCGQNGSWGECVQTTVSSTEICDNQLDDDCDGYIDAADTDCQQPPTPCCGDGVVNQTSEQCDDGNTTNGDGCSSSCQTEYIPPVCLGCYGPPYCGDHTKNGSEECDDGNIFSGDGCSADCKTEGGLVAGTSTCNLDLDVMVVMDVSASMGEDSPTRLSLAQIAANSFIDNLRNSDQSGLVSFNRTATLNKNLSYDHTVTKSIISGLTAGGSTNMGAAIDKANNELMSVANNLQLAKVEILLTDGRANRPTGDGFNENPADVALALAESLEAAENGIMIYTIGLGGDVNTGMLQTIANNTGGKYYFSPTSNDLNGIFSQIAAETCRSAFPTYVSPAITIFNEKAGAISDTGATVTWYTNIPATSRVVYGNQQMSVLGDAPNYGYAFSTPEQDSVSKVISHSVTISDLIPNTTYYVRCVSQTARSTELTFTTLGAGEVIPTIPAPEEGEVAGVETETPEGEVTAPEAAGGEETFVAEGAEAAVGGFVAGTTLCWILFIVTILLSLWSLRLKRKGVENKNKRLILFVVVVLLILYYFICCVGCTTCCLKFWVLVVINAILFVISLFVKKKSAS